jgi:hypothetical protein
LAAVGSDFGFTPRRQRGQLHVRRQLAERIWLIATDECLVARAEQIVLDESGVAGIGPQSARVRAFDRDEVADGGEIPSVRADGERWFGERGVAPEFASLRRTTTHRSSRQL